MRERSVLTDAMRSPFPWIEFYRLVEQAPLPTRADRSTCGHLPLRAQRYCESVTGASGLGYYLYSPLKIAIILKKGLLYYTYAGLENWYCLDAIQYPHFSAKFDASAPDNLKGYAPPFLTALPENGHFQMWTGLIAKTAPNFSILVRPVVNMPPPIGYYTYEGIVESDRWFGPLFLNFRITRENKPILFDLETPVAQLQILHRDSYAGHTRDESRIYTDISDISLSEWNEYLKNIVTPNLDRNRKAGNYAISVRRRRRRDTSTDLTVAADFDRANCPYAFDG